MQATMNAENAQLHTLAQEVAKSIGWEYLEPSDEAAGSHSRSHRPMIRRADGLCIALAFTWGHKGKVTCSNCETWPQGAYVSNEIRLLARDIYVSLERGPQVIGREILRRLVPEAEKLKAAYDEIRARHNGYKAQSEATATKLADAGCERWPNSGSDGTSIALGGPEHTRVTAEGDRVRFEAFSVDVDVAVELVRILRAAQVRSAEARTTNDEA